MTVQDLIALLEDCNPEADVLLVTQPHYPFECALRGAAVREELGLDFDPDADPGTGDCAEKDAAAGTGDANRTDTWSNTGNPSDVLLLEGGQLRYGHRGCFGG